MNSKQLNHDFARAIFDHALSSVDPRQAVKNSITLQRLNASHIYAIAIGKAASSMAAGLEEVLGKKLTARVISAGGHPLPNEASLETAQAAFALLDRANAEQAAVIFLISGGGPQPEPSPTKPPSSVLATSASTLATSSPAAIPTVLRRIERSRRHWPNWHKRPRPPHPSARLTKETPHLAVGRQICNPQITQIILCVICG